MKRSLSILLTVALVFTMVIGSAGSVFAADSTAATTMKIAGTDGTVTITTDKGKDIAANVDTKLLNGYTVKTAAASYCFISLDDSKAIKLGQNTKVKVEKSNKKIELNLKSGEIYFDVDKKLSGNESMNIKTGNMTTGIRGTSGVTIVSHNMYSITPDASGIKPQETASNTLFQLFSGSTVVKENNPTSLKSLLGRLLSAVPGSGAKINPIKTPGPITAQAGQQIAIAAAPKGGGETTASRFETQALAVNEFGARAVLEAAAIKTGMSAGEALTVGTAQIVAQVGEGLTQTLAAAGVAQAAVTQVAEAASDPAKLDSAKQNAELQAALAELTSTETIDTAKQDAAKVEGTKTNDKALEKVDVQAGSGANAGGLKLSDDGVSTTATQSPQTSTGGHSGGSSGGTVELPGITGYVGTYDGEPHPIGTVDADLASNYHVVLFDNEVGYSTCKEAMRSIDSTGGFNTADERYEMLISALDANEVSYEPYTSDGMPQACEVADSHTWNWYALPNVATDSSIFGSFNVYVSRAPLEVVWYVRGGGHDMSVVATPGAAYVSTAAISSQGPAVPNFFTTIGGVYKEVHLDTVSGYGIEAVAFMPYGAFMNSGPAQTQTGYSLLVEGLSLSVSGQDNRPVVRETDNFYYPGGSSYEYTLIDDSQGNTGGDTGSAGPSEVDGSFFSNQGPWDDRTEYDIAFVANGTQADPTSSDAPPIPVYDKYFKGDTERREAGCTIGDIVAVLANTTSYASVYIDTGDAVKPISDNMVINTGSFNRAVFISGAGFSWSNSGYVNTNATGTNGELYIKLGSNESDVETQLENVQNIYIAPKATLINSGEFTLGYQMQIYGDVQNYGEIYISAAATGSLDPIKIFSGGILEQYDGGMIWDKREIKLNSNSSLTGGRTTYGVESGGTMKLWGGALRRTITSDSAEPADTTSKVALRARAIFSVQGTERISYDGNYYFEPINQSGETLEAVSEGIVLCTYSGGGTVLGARLEGDNRVFHDSANGDFPVGTFFVTGENSEVNSDDHFVEITFPHPAGTFAPAN